MTHMRSFRPRHSDSKLERLIQDPPKFKPLGWYSISGWVEPCPECGAYRGGTPGYHWHVVRENSDDWEKILAAHGEEYVIMGTLKESACGLDEGAVPEDEAEACSDGDV